MNKLVKSLLIVGSVIALASCSSLNSEKSGNERLSNEMGGKTFGLYSVNDLQQRYNTIYFDSDKYNIDNKYTQILDAQAAYLNANPVSRVVVEGNTDENGTPEYNIALGQRRADAVKAYLVGKGVEGSRISTVSYGEEKPAVLGHDEMAYSKNRRAVLVY